jgi:hypothetical protein
MSNQTLSRRHSEINFDNYSTLELSSLLVNFYADARKKNGEKYKLSALKSIRFGLELGCSAGNNRCCSAGNNRVASGQRKFWQNISIILLSHD